MEETVQSGFVESTLFKLAIASQRRKAGMKRRVIEVGGETWPYLEGGDGPPVLALHGFTANKGHWGRMCGFFTREHRLIVPDLPGFGETARHSEWNYDIQNQMVRLDAFVKALGLECFHLVGNSMGGQLAAAYTLAFPDKVATLSLIDHAGTTESHPSDMTRAVERGENPLVVGDIDDYQRMLAFVFSTPPCLPSIMKRYLAKREIQNGPFNLKIFDDLRRNWVAFDDDFPKLHTPTLIVWGSDDRVFDVSAAHRSHELLPDSELVVLENTGHVPIMEKPEETATAVLDFIRCRTQD